VRTKTEVTIERPRDEVFRRFVDEMATQKNRRRRINDR